VGQGITLITFIISLEKGGIKQKVPRKVHVNTASAEEKDEFKKRSNKYLWVSPAPTNTKRRRGRKTLP
jgi:hypothetical protein